jgi:hypothetical protein
MWEVVDAAVRVDADVDGCGECVPYVTDSGGFALVEFDKATAGEEPWEDDGSVVQELQQSATCSCFVHTLFALYFFAWG